MKRKSILFLALSGMILQVSAFEGVIKQKYFTANNPSDITVTWKLKEGKCALDMEFKQDKINTTTHFVPNTSTFELVTYTDGADKTYRSTQVQKIKGGPEMAFSRMDVKVTNETKQIFGLNCFKVILTTNEHITEVWVTKDHQEAYYPYASFFRSALDFQGLNQEKIKGFPVQFETKDIAGKVILKAECIGVTPGKVASTAFEVPAGYTLSK